MNFTCFAEGIPKPVISWRKERQRLRSVSGSVEISESGNVFSLINVNPTNGGYYTCLAMNEVGDDRRAARLRVLGDTISVNCINVTFYCFIILVVPAITTPQQTVRFVLKRPAWLPCDAEGTPDPVIRWLKDGIDVSDEVRYQILTNGTLYINELQLGDAGVFECVATNEGGKASVNVTIVVMGIIGIVSHL